jgi:hypothetical protein
MSILVVPVYYGRYSVVSIEKWISIRQLVPVLFRVSRSPGGKNKDNHIEQSTIVILTMVQDLTFVIFLGLSVLLAPALKVIPIAVLFGVFVYLGTISLSGNQFVIRTVMFFMPPKHYPDFRFVRKVTLANVPQVEQMKDCQKHPLPADYFSKHNMKVIPNKECILITHNFKILYISNQV